MKKNQLMEKMIHGLFLLLGLITVGCVLLITVYLVISGIPAIREIGLVDFLFGKEWASTASEPKYGILPFILTSVYGTAGAIVIGVPVGFMTAVYLSLFLHASLREYRGSRGHGIRYGKLCRDHRFRRFCGWCGNPRPSGGSGEQ